MRERRKEAISQIHRNIIISVAEQLFMQRGYDNVTMDDISKAAEYSKRTVYVYFKSKEEIYNKIILRAMHMLKETVEKSISSRDNILMRYELLCNNLANFYEFYPIYFLSSIGFEGKLVDMEKSPSIIIDIFNVGEEINLIISTFLKEGIKQGIFKEDIEILPTVFVFWSSIASSISFAAKKQEYIKDVTGMGKDVFLKYSFKTLLNSILK